jgi:hypothetical protein
MVASFGMTTPYWDQWDAEIDRLYRPWIDGALRWQSMIAPHNEHRVFTGRVLALLLFVLRGNVLDVMLEITVNAILHTAALLLLLNGLSGMFSENRQKFFFTLFAALIFAMPLGVENLLINNSALYFLILFSILFLRAVSDGTTQVGSVWYFSVLANGLLACLSFASGALTLAAGIALLGYQWISGVRRNRSTLVIIVVLSVMMLAAVYFTPSLPGHSHYRSRSVTDFVISILRMTGGLVFYIPSASFMLRQIRRKPHAGDSSWFLFALCLWIMGQMVVIAYGRGHSNVLTSRYLDLYTIGFVANLAALFANMRDSESKWSSNPIKAWVFLLFTGFGIFLPQIIRNLESMKANSIEYEQRVRRYLVTHDATALEEPGAVIPYPDPARLRKLLDQRIVQSILPANLTADGADLSKSKKGSREKIIFLAGSVLTGVSVGLFGVLLYCREGLDADEIPACV